MEKKILIVQSTYYKEIANGLCNGVTKYINDRKNLSNTVDIIFKILDAPGSFEIPLLINQNKELFDGFVALGCIIRGETYHFEIISNEVTRKIMDLSIEIDKPIGFGILTCENLAQAMQRSGPHKGNKGAEAAKACLSLLLHPR